jgi:hypothetical protein
MIPLTIPGADPGFQVRGDALKKIAPSGGRREHFWGISCEKSRFYAKKHIFSNFRGGGRAPGVPPWIRPCILSLDTDETVRNLSIEFSVALLRLVARLFMFSVIFNEQRVPKFTFALVLTYYVNRIYL